MENISYTAVANSENSIVIYEATTGNFITDIYVTTGSIIGQPTISGNIISVVCTENGSRVLKTYELPSFQPIQVINLN